MSRWHQGALALLPACHADLRVVNAEVSQEQRIREVVDTFRAELLPGVELEVDTIVLSGRFTPEVGGAALRQGRRVLLSDTIEPHALEHVLRHELCHAIDLQNGRPAADRSWPELPPVPASADALQQSEMFAYLCEMGPAGMMLLRDVAGACLPAGVPDVIMEILEDYYPPPEPVERMAAPRFEVPPPEGYRVEALMGFWIRSGSGLLPVALLHALEGADRSFLGLDLTLGQWDMSTLSNVAAPVASAEALERAGLKVDLPAWIDDDWLLPGGVALRTRSSVLAWDAEVAVVELVPGVYADGCLGDRPTVLALERGVVVDVRPDALEGMELTGALDALHGAAWR
jgi:hypothetical protein